ncbi:MAG: ChaN family lipoprotein, partial [Proteobacteria bacterium]|nr:ChaN family lipoprotein [Pseudomonadota bacterium]
MKEALRAGALFLALTLGACGGSLNRPLLQSGETALSRGLTCAPVGQWVTGTGQPISHARAIELAAGADIVLLGEQHGSPTHPLWQFSVAAGILARKPGMALAFEMLPRQAQRALDRYAAGATDDKGFLKEADWPA